MDEAAPGMDDDGAAAAVVARRGAERALLSALDLDLLLAIAWLAPVTQEHLRQLLDAQLHRERIRRHLRRLEARGLIAACWYLRQEGQGPPRRAGLIWWLEAAGWEAIRERGQAPPRWAPPPRVLIEHDLLVSEVVVQVVVAGRRALSGLYLEREPLLDPARRRPRCDAILIIRRQPAYAPQRLPWLWLPPAPGEQIRGYALEIDRDTEPLGVIHDKAVAYQSVWRDSQFFQRYGRMPIPLWVVPSERRLQAIQRVWQQAWPDGRWLITTDAGLRADRWWQYHQGAWQQQALLAGWEPSEEDRDA